MGFDFDAAVTAPFRMQPGLRRLADARQSLTPCEPGSRHQREKLAVLSAFWPQALVAQAGFDARPALHALMAFAALTHPEAWQWDGHKAHAPALGAAVDKDGQVVQVRVGSFGLGDEMQRCLLGLPPPWRQVGLLSLAFCEDFAIVNGRDSSIPWLAVALPSHWAPETKVGLPFAAVHAPVADNTMLIKAAAQLTKLVCGPDRWERFVWNVTDQPRLHAHPLRTTSQRWLDTPIAQASWRTEHQTFIPLPELQQAVFTIHVQVQPLAQVLARQPARAQALHEALASMSNSVLAYRGLAAVRPALLAWLTEQAEQAEQGEQAASLPAAG